MSHIIMQKRFKKILIMGLPGAGKTTLANALAPLLNAVHFNADMAREVVSKELGFSITDRLDHAKRMGWMCDQVTKGGHFAIADFICPTKETRNAFGSDDAFIIWIDRIKEGRFEDTNKLFIEPTHYDLRVSSEGTPEYWANKILHILRPSFDSKAPTALLLGRFQPCHDGHITLIKESLNRVGQVCICVRDTQDIDASNPFNFYDVKARLEAGLKGYEGQYIIVHLPNITHIHYGRDVGYAIERIILDKGTEEISATKIREKIFNEEAA